jgi:hypothetical protein
MTRLDDSKFAPGDEHQRVPGQDIEVLRHRPARLEPVVKLAAELVDVRFGADQAAQCCVFTGYLLRSDPPFTLEYLNQIGGYAYLMPQVIGDCWHHLTLKQFSDRVKQFIGARAATHPAAFSLFR